MADYTSWGTLSKRHPPYTHTAPPSGEDKDIVNSNFKIGKFVHFLYLCLCVLKWSTEILLLYDLYCVKQPEQSRAVNLPKLVAFPGYYVI